MEKYDHCILMDLFFFFFSLKSSLIFLVMWLSPKLSSGMNSNQTLLSNYTGATGHDLGDFCLRLSSSYQ